MKVNDVYNYIDSFAPFISQAEWDNSGLLVGNGNDTVNKIIFALDITDNVIDQAIEINANLIITHHPIIFKPVKNVLDDSLIYKLIENKISIICAHTNLDIAIGGVNDILCEKIDFESYYKIENSFLNIGILKDELQAIEFAKYIKEKLNCIVRFNDYNNKIKKVAICSGAGSDFIYDARKFNCDALLTGDGKHHDFLDATQIGLSLFSAGHFETENPVILPLMNKIKNNFDIECVIARQKSPIITI